MNTRNLTASYFGAQSLLVLLWWLTLWLHPPSRLFFLPSGGADVLLLAFWLPDLVLIVAGGLVAGALCRRRSAAAGIALWMVVGSLSYATLYCLALSFFTNSAWISVALMSVSTFLSAGLAVLYTNPPLALFRQARPANPSWNLAKTLAQIAAFWSLFLFLLPALINRVEDEICVPRFHFSGQREIAATVFGLLSLLGLFGGLIWNYVARPMEEADLAHKFGASYERYLDEVKCWRPRLTPFVIYGETEEKVCREIQ